jgi:polyisoprenoid-binding protein YceI
LPRKAGWRRSKFCTPLVLGLLVTSALPAYAEQLTVDLDSGKTQVAFILKDVLHTVHGTFHVKEGHLFVDAATGAVSGDVVVDAASGNSGSAARDKRMTRDVLQAQQFPEIRFQPSNEAGPIQPAGASDIQVTGLFLIHGQSHKMTIPMHVQVSADDVTATGLFEVPYVAWGMKDPSNFLLKVNDSVQIDVNAVGHIRRPGSTVPVECAKNDVTLSNQRPSFASSSR